MLSGGELFMCAQSTMEAANMMFVSPVDMIEVKLSKAELLRGIVTEKLTTAAQEIFAAVERTVAGYEEEAAGLRQEIDRQRIQLEAVLQPRVSVSRTDQPVIKQEEEEEPQITTQSDVEDSESWYGFGLADEEEDHEEPQERPEVFEKKESLEEAVNSTSLNEEEDLRDPDIELSETRTQTLKRKLSETSRLTKSEALAKIQDVSEGESDGGEISDISDVDWSEEESSDSEPESPGTKNKRLVPPVGDSSQDPSLEYSKDGTMWKATEPMGHSRGRQAQNVHTESAGPTDHAKRSILDPMSAFLCLLDLNILQHIRDCTVEEAHRVEGNMSWDLSIAELKAFIALLYVRGAYNKNIDFESLWSEEWGLAFCRTTMPRNHFRKIMRYLRFDKKHERQARLCNDKFALMSDVWGGFINNCIACYNPGACITVDEQLFPTKTCCRFTQFKAGKPGKIGIKFWLSADTETRYLLNGFPYLGKDQQAQGSLEENVVMKLVEPYIGKGRNVTTSSSLTTLSLAKNLLQKNTSLVGIMKKTRPELPPSVQQHRGELFSTKVLKHEGATLTIYQAKPRKAVTVLSTMHPTVFVGSKKKKNPETVIYCNVTKVGVDVLDQMARLYTVKGPARRWPLAVFYNLLDMAAINAHILYKACTSTYIPRRAFILQLAKELRDEHCYKAIFTSIPLELQSPQDSGKRKQCRVRTHCKQNKTLVSCRGCNRPVCGRCTLRVETFCNLCVHQMSGCS
ncbi:uncharacterized protein LOC121504472 [Cheilinus undulatus]|uniref:uncharacterized protein LOC121504472 n=1 Tax=Cheilinus undulatus TaxID=241271 RepID=UPI001BD2D5A4|nr:uncharacterized protein LOC121504472 [Cheilinus undulatus]